MGRAISATAGGLIQALEGWRFSSRAAQRSTEDTRDNNSGVIRNLGTATLNDVTNNGAFIANNASVTTLGGTINVPADPDQLNRSFTNLLSGGRDPDRQQHPPLQNAARSRHRNTL